MYFISLFKFYKEQTFFKTVMDMDVLKDEPPFLERTNEIPGLDYDNKDFYQDRQNLPFPPKVNKIKRENLQRVLGNKKD